MKLLPITFALLAFTNTWALNPNDYLSQMGDLGTVQKQFSFGTTCTDGFEHSLDVGEPHSTIPTGFDSLGTPLAKWTVAAHCPTPTLQYPKLHLGTPSSTADTSWKYSKRWPV